jgi:hypothetical protein
MTDPVQLAIVLLVATLLGMWLFVRWVSRREPKRGDWHEWQPRMNAYKAQRRFESHVRNCPHCGAQAYYDRAWHAQH